MKRVALTGLKIYAGYGIGPVKGQVSVGGGEKEQIMEEPKAAMMELA